MATTVAHSSVTAKKNNGATVLGGGNVDTTNTVSNSPSILDYLNEHSVSPGSKVVAVTGTKFQTGVQTAKGSGKLAYQPTADDPQFLIRGYSTKVNNVANTVLQSGGSDKAGRRAINLLNNSQIHDHTSINYVTGALTKGGTAGNSYAYVQAADGSTAATDDAASPTRAIPGELVYMFGAKIPKQDDYKAKTG